MKLKKVRLNKVKRPKINGATNLNLDEFLITPPALLLSLKDFIPYPALYPTIPAFPNLTWHSPAIFSRLSKGINISFLLYLTLRKIKVLVARVSGR